MLSATRSRLFPLRDKILAPAVGIDDVHPDAVIVRDAVPRVVLEEIDLLRAVRVDRVRLAESEVLVPNDDTVPVLLVVEDVREGDVVDEVGRVSCSLLVVEPPVDARKTNALSDLCHMGRDDMWAYLKESVVKFRTGTGSPTNCVRSVRTTVAHMVRNAMTDRSICVQG